MLWASSQGALHVATLFSKIIAGEIPASIVYANEHVVAFRDINPQAPVHIVIATRQEIPGVSSVEEQGDHLALLNAAKEIAVQEGLVKGYRLVINEGKDGDQSIPHLHMHLLGGRAMNWPPG
jgi:histidine triad (HIT) family protein